MTEKANPSNSRPIESFKTAGAIAYGGGTDGFISPSSEPSEISVQDGSINESNLNAFQETSSGTSLDVTIDGGEAFVFGSWIAIDTQTTVTLSGSTTGQIVYAGWNKDGSDDVIIGLSSDFASASGDNDQKIELYSFDTDSSGVVGVDDRRSFDQIKASSIEQGDGSGLDADAVDGFDVADLDGRYVTESGDTMSGPLTIGGDLSATDGETVWDESAGYIPQSRLENDSLTVAGNSVNLGGATAISHPDLSAISSDDHHIRYSDEEAQDAVGNILNPDFIYDDSGNQISLSEDTVTVAGNSVSLGESTNIDHNDLSSISSDDHHIRYSDEEAQDAVGNILNPDFIYDDSGNQISLSEDTVTVAGNSVSLGGSTNIDHNDLSSISSDDHHIRYSDEEAQDAVGTILGALLSYDDATPSIEVAIDDDEILTFGTGDDVSQRYDSTNDDIRWRDETNSADRMALDRTTGDLSIEGTITEGNTL